MDFWRFKPVSADAYKIVEAEYNYFLVAISLLISAFAAYALLVILERAWLTISEKSIRLWKLFGSIVFGLGVWAMHFTGMLAYMIPIEMSFNVELTVFSIFTPMVGAYLSLNILVKQNFSFSKMQFSALSLALGIGSMHFVGMEAMEMGVVMHYDPLIFVASIIIAHLLATVAIYLIRNLNQVKTPLVSTKVLSAVILGAAVSCMHYIAMKAVSYYAYVDTIFHNHDMNHSAVTFSLAIAAIVFIIVATTILCALVDDKLHKAEATIEQSAIREKDMVENLPDGMLTIDSFGVVHSINSAGFLMFGYEREAIIGLNLSSLMKHDKLDVLSSQSLDEIFQGSLGETFVAQGIKEDKKVFPIEVNFSKISIQNEDGNVFNCVARDITKRIELESKLRQSQKLESIGQLSAGIAHEINTPTQYVADNTVFLKTAFESCNIILEKIKVLTDKDIADIKQDELIEIQALFEEHDMDFVLTEIPYAAEQSIEGLDRIKNIIGAMKSFSHSNLGEMSLVDIAEAIESTVTVSRSEWRYIAEMKTNYAEVLPKITCLRDEFNQVVLNFIVNAAHAIEEKLGEKSTQLGCIHIDVTADKKHLNIKISDDGIGMTDEVKARIYDPFFTTKDVGKGTGQGLSMAYLVIVEKFKGSITLESELNVGTTFTISLPIE